GADAADRADAAVGVGAAVRSGPAGTAVRLVAGAAGASCAGLWLGGYLGAIVLLVTCGSFAAVLTLGRRYRLADLACSPWLVAGLLIAASVSQAIGAVLRDEGVGGATVTSLWNAGPQLLCLIIVGRLLAALVTG